MKHLLKRRIALFRSVVFGRLAARLSLAAVICAAASLSGGCATAQDRGVQLLSGSSPMYPIEAKQKKVEGIVVVRYGVSEDGRVVNARVERADPPGVFDDAALKAVRSWHYNPAIRNGVPVAVDNVLSTVRFQLSADDTHWKR
jgi:TonB family protein